MLKKDNPVNVKTSIKALLLSLNVEDSDNGVGMAFLWQQSHFSCSYTKLHILSHSSGKCIYVIGKTTAYPQIFLNTRNTRFGNFAWKEGKHKSCKKFDFPRQILSRLLRWNYTYEKKIAYILKPAVSEAFMKKSKYTEFYA